MYHIVFIDKISCYLICSKCTYSKVIVDWTKIKGLTKIEKANISEYGDSENPWRFQKYEYMNIDQPVDLEYEHLHNCRAQKCHLADLCFNNNEW